MFQLHHLKVVESESGMHVADSIINDQHLKATVAHNEPVETSWPPDTPPASNNKNGVLVTLDSRRDFTSSHPYFLLGITYF